MEKIGTSENFKAGFVYHVECLDKDGNLKWEERIKNLVTTAGRNDIIDVYLRNQTQTAAWYVGLTDGTPTVAAGDTMASHAGWTEVTGYSESVRQTLTLAAASAGSATNSASKASFSINATITAGGAFVTSDSTKSGTTGTLFSVSAFTGGDRGAVNGDTINVTATFTVTDS